MNDDVYYWGTFLWDLNSELADTYGIIYGNYVSSFHINDCSSAVSFNNSIFGSMYYFTLPNDILFDTNEPK